MNDLKRGWLHRRPAGGLSPPNSVGGWRTFATTSREASAFELDAFELAPFNQKGGLARAYRLFGEALTQILEALNLTLAG